MSKLAQTLEELQRDILQGDLKDNPYLQGSTVPLLDKELKTKAKKIIPAINELLKTINTFSDGISTFMDEVKNEVNELKEEIQDMKKSISKLSDSDEELKKRYDECIKKAAEIELDVKLIKNDYMNTKFKGDIMELKNKVKLKKGESAVIGSVEELYDPKKQIKIYAYEENSKKYKFIDYEFKKETWGNSAYTFDVTPIELQIDGENSDVLLVNRSSWELIIFVYK